MSLAGQDGATDGDELVQLRPDRTRAPGPARDPAAGAAGPAGPAADPAGTTGSTALFRRRSAHASRRGVLHLQSARDTPAPPDLATWFTERGFHFYVAALRWPRSARRGRGRGGRALAAAFADLDARCEQLRTADGIDNVIVTAHGEGALAAALWCAAPSSAGHPDALILYAPLFGRGGRAARRGLDIPCPVLVIGGSGRASRPGQRAPAVPAAAPIHLGSHVTWLRPADAQARPDASAPEDRRRFFDEVGRWLGTYMYGQVRDQLL
jgi:alpha-beta hydrolase superfamily lysophospholipase